ncbi:MAG: hypothetical protein AAEJ47_07415 [Planctomycetota bacterium]
MQATSLKTPDLAIAIRVLRQRSWVADELLVDALQCCPRDPDARDLLEILTRRSCLSVSLANQILRRTRDLLRTRIADNTRRRGEDQALGRLALGRGWLSTRKLEDAILEQSQLRKIGLRFRIGEVLVRRGVLSGDQVRILLDEQGRLARTCNDCGLVAVDPGPCAICGQDLLLAPALGPYSCDLEFSKNLVPNS